MNLDFKKRYEIWFDRADESLRGELEAIADDKLAIQDAFYRDLEFGTAGLRGIVGAGSNRMNIHTVARATQGFANYLNECRPINPIKSDLCSLEKTKRPAPTVAICRDSRRMGEEFVKIAAGVLAANGIKSFIFPRVEPTPALSFAVRDLGCSGGINITASHNPAEYNGYKVYGPDGCQITTEAAKAIQSSIDDVDIFDDIKIMDFTEALDNGWAVWIDEKVLDNYIEAVYAQSLEVPGSKESLTPLSIVYTPLNGTGLECVSRILKRIGIEDFSVVVEQAMPNGEFPTCPYPNPESHDALERGLALCESVRPDILIATDPDADRVGVAVKHGDEYCLISGNDMGVLMLDYICQMRKAKGEDLSKEVVVTTIVSTTMVDELASDFGFELRRTLTGFKYIGEQILNLELQGEQARFIFGFEESYGYMSGSHVRDKDAINATMIICQMARWHKSFGNDLIDALHQLHERYGYFMNRTINVEYPGAEGEAKMSSIMDSLRSGGGPKIVGGLEVVDVIDYEPGAAMPVVNLGDDVAQNLPSANVVEFILSSGCKMIVRPSGTEPKIKAYLFAKATDQKGSEELLDLMESSAHEILGSS